MTAYKSFGEFLSILDRDVLATLRVYHIESRITEETCVKVWVYDKFVCQARICDIRRELTRAGIRYEETLEYDWREHVDTYILSTVQ